MNKFEYKIVESPDFETTINAIEVDGWNVVSVFQTGTIRILYRIILKRPVDESGSYMAGISSWEDDCFSTIVKLVSNPDLVNKNIDLLQKNIQAHKDAMEQSRIANNETTKNLNTLAVLEKNYATAKSSLDAQQVYLEAQRMAHAVEKAALINDRSSLTDDRCIHEAAEIDLRNRMSMFDIKESKHNDLVTKDKLALESRAASLDNFSQNLDGFHAKLNEKALRLDQEEEELRAKAKKFGIVSALFPDK